MTAQRLLSLFVFPCYIFGFPFGSAFHAILSFMICQKFARDFRGAQIEADSSKLVYCSFMICFLWLISPAVYFYFAMLFDGPDLERSVQFARDLVSISLIESNLIDWEVGTTSGHGPRIGRRLLVGTVIVATFPLVASLAWPGNILLITSGTLWIIKALKAKASRSLNIALIFIGSFIPLFVQYIYYLAPYKDSMKAVSHLKPQLLLLGLTGIFPHGFKNQVALLVGTHITICILGYFLLNRRSEELIAALKWRN